MKKWYKVIAFVLVLTFAFSFQLFNVNSVYAAEKKEAADEYADSVKSFIEGIVDDLKQSDCDTKEDVDALIDSSVKGQISYYEQQYSQQGSELSDSDKDEIKASIEKNLSWLYDWVDIHQKSGDVKELKSHSYEVMESDEDTVISIKAELTCEKRDTTMLVKVSTTGASETEYSFELEPTFGELMKKAALNTVLGMGTVFVVLIFLCILIELFKFIPSSENNKKQETTVAPAVSAPIEAEDDVTDDLELVAVISAAIAAAEGTSADGFHVRSIKRVRRSNW